MAIVATSTVTVGSALSSALQRLASRSGQLRSTPPQTHSTSAQSVVGAPARVQSPQRLAYLTRVQASLNPAHASLLRLDLTALGAAIHSGNLTSAKTAFVTFKGDLRNVPQQQLNYSDSGLSQTATRADVRIDLLDSISRTAQEAASQLRQTAVSDLATNIGAIINAYA